MPEYEHSLSVVLVVAFGACVSADDDGWLQFTIAMLRLSVVLLAAWHIAHAHNACQM